MSTNYYVLNKATGKIELHFEKATYMALDENEKSKIKSNFLFSRNSGAWVSRCKFPNHHRAADIAKSLGLENAGEEGERRTFEEQQEIKAIKAENRAARYEYKAEKATENGEALQSGINRMHGDISFFTQPNINTSAGRAFTRKRDKMWAAWERGFEEFKKSEYYEERAKIARETAETATAPKDKSFCIRRIEEAKKTIRAQHKNIDSYNEKLEKLEAGETIKRYNGEILTAENVQNWIDEAYEIIETSIEKVIYYQNCIDNLGGINYSKENIKPGYIVELKRWGKCKVVSTGPKNITYTILTGGAAGFGGVEPYAAIEKVIEAKEPEEQEILHPFKVGDNYSFDFWNGEKYAPIEYTITKVTPQKVTLKHGTERARVVSVRKTWDGLYCLALEGAKNWIYKKAE